MLQKNFFFGMLFLFLTIISPELFADAKGEEIAKKNYELKQAKNDFSVVLLAIYDKNGKRKVRKFEMYTRDGDKGRDSFIEFLEPSDVKGIKFLIFGNKKGDDEQRMFLPALGKVRRIASSQKGGKFMNSDLYYYDLDDQALEDFTYTYIKEDEYNGMLCDVIESVPLDKDAPYSKQIVWISKDDSFAYKIECYDKKNKTLLKTILFLETTVIDTIIIAKRMVIDNNSQGTKTIMELQDIKVNQDIPDTIFSLQNLD
ncbi:MAG: outer membrane lipoprotein-sorting protein [Spirochaetales bacterium]|nr:outer membrane lipoprotein-sorting protein [Spirochaetales bacterium]